MSARLTSILLGRGRFAQACRGHLLYARDSPADPQDLGLWTRDNGLVYVPTAFAQQPRFLAAVARAAQRLAPQVVSVIPTLGNDWSGEPAVFFMVILADSASGRDRLLNITNQVEQAIVQQVQPLEQWGVLPYFNFRTESEQAKLNQPTSV